MSITRKLMLYAALLCAAIPAFARQRTQGFCQQGGQTVNSGGLISSTKVQQSFPGCTVTVYLTGTLTLATLYNADGSGKGNPFTADLTTGLWSYYADDGRYDVKMSGAGISSPFTWSDLGIVDIPATVGTAGQQLTVAPAATSNIWQSKSCRDVRDVAGADVFAQANALMGTTACISIPYNGGSCYSVTTTLAASSSFVTIEGNGNCITFSGVGNGINISSPYVIVRNLTINPSGAAGSRIGVKIAPAAYNYSLQNVRIISPDTTTCSNQFNDGLELPAAYYFGLWNVDVIGMNRSGYHITNGSNAIGGVNLAARGGLGDATHKCQQYGFLFDTVGSNGTGFDCLNCTAEGNTIDGIHNEGMDYVTWHGGHVEPTGAVLQTGTITIPTTALTVTTAALTSNVALITITGSLAAEGITTGSHIEVYKPTGTVDAATYAGAYTVTSTPSDTTFTYALTHANIGSTAISGTVYKLDVAGAGTTFTSMLVGQSLRNDVDAAKYLERTAGITDNTHLWLLHAYHGTTGAGLAWDASPNGAYIGTIAGSTPNCASGQTVCAISNVFINTDFTSSLGAGMGLYVDAGGFGTKVVNGDMRVPYHLDSQSTGNTIDTSADSGDGLNLGLGNNIIKGVDHERITVTESATATQVPFFVQGTAGATVNLLQVNDSGGKNIFAIGYTGGISGGTAGGSWKFTPSTDSNGNIVLSPRGATNTVFVQPNVINQSDAIFVSRAFTGQTGSAFEVQDINGVMLSKFTVGGALSTTQQVTSTVATGAAPFVVASTTPVANLTAVPLSYNTAGTQVVNAHLVVGTCTLGTNCGITLSGAAVFTGASSYSCGGTDETAANPVRITMASGSAFTVEGTGTDLIRFVCAGN
jgi:hypothetical protein